MVLEPYTVVGGVAAKVIKYRFSIDTVIALKQSKWWSYVPGSLNDFGLTAPERFVEDLLSEEESLPIYEPVAPAARDLVEFAL